MTGAGRGGGAQGDDIALGFFVGADAGSKHQHQTLWTITPDYSVGTVSCCAWCALAWRHAGLVAALLGVLHRLVKPAGEFTNLRACVQGVYLP